MLIISTANLASERQLNAKCIYKNIYFINNGLHTELAFNLDDFPYLKDKFKGSKYIHIGYGDKDFFEAGDFFSLPKLEQLKLAFNALFIPSPGILSVTPSNYDPANYASKTLQLNQADYKKISDFVESSFRKSSNDSLKLISGNLYEAKGDYSILNTCNNWTSEALSQSPVLKLSSSIASILEEQLNDELEKQKIENATKNVNCPSIISKN